MAGSDKAMAREPALALKILLAAYMFALHLGGGGTIATISLQPIHFANNVYTTRWTYFLALC